MPRRQPCLYCEKTQLAKFGSPTLHLGRSRNAALRSGGWGNEPYVKKKKKKICMLPAKSRCSRNICSTHHRHACYVYQGRKEIPPEKISPKQKCMYPNSDISLMPFTLASVMKMAPITYLIFQAKNIVSLLWETKSLELYLSFVIILWYSRRV